MSRTALVTGSTSGIGKALVEKMAKEKYDLVLVSRNYDKLEEQSKVLINQFGIKIKTIAINLLEPNAANEIYTILSNNKIEIEILVNNAGFNECGPFLETNGKNEIDMIRLHIQHTTEMMKIFLPDMVSRGKGYVLNLGSTGSYIACPNDAVYSATKAYILFLSKSVNAELKGTGVSITALCPGSTRTEFAKKAGINNTLLFKLFVMEPEQVANVGYKALIKRKQSIIVGLYNKLLVFSSKITPPFILYPLVKKMMKKK